MAKVGVVPAGLALGQRQHLLERWDEAVLTLKDSRRTGAVKVLLEPGR